MDLKDYVQQTLIDITSGVAEAQRKSQLWIAPGMIEGQPRLDAQMVKFEVEVVVSSDGGGSLKVWSFGEAKANINSQRSNRLTFEVPVYFQSFTPNHEKYVETYPKVTLRDQKS